jgi:two-component system NtrC family sensor kinase
MKLAAKLVSAVLLAVGILLALDGYFTVQREIELFQTDMRRDARVLGRTLQPLVEHAWRAGGAERALRLVAEANEQEELVTIRWVWLTGLPDERYRPHASHGDLGQLLNRHHLSFVADDEHGEGYLYTYIPVAVDGQEPGALELSESLRPLATYTRNSIVRTVVLSVLLVVAGILVLVPLGIGLVGRPLHRLIAKVRSIGAGDLSAPLQIRGRDEIAEVAEALNTMCEQLAEAQERVQAEMAARITALEQLRHADRLRTVGRLASGVAHELGTPLNVVSGRAGLIGSGELPPSEVAENAKIIKVQSERMTTIIRQLLDFARRRAPQRVLLDVRKIVRAAVDLLGSVAQKRNATVSLTGLPGPVMAQVDAGQVQQVVTNLVVNALQAIPQGGKVEVGVRREDAHAPDGDTGCRDCVCVYVRDEGEGIPEENIPHIFEPFFTTKDIGEGTGLGLSIVYGIVREHGGWIDVTSDRGKGTCFTVYLPQGVVGCTAES